MPHNPYQGDFSFRILEHILQKRQFDATYMTVRIFLFVLLKEGKIYKQQSSTIHITNKLLFLSYVLVKSLASIPQKKGLARLTGGLLATIAARVLLRMLGGYSINSLSSLANHFKARHGLQLCWMRILNERSGDLTF